MTTIAPEGYIVRGRSLAQDQGNRCYYCGKPFGRKNPPTVEHKTPLNRGGRSEPSNLAAACNACNNAKGGMTEAEYRAQVARLGGAK